MSESANGKSRTILGDLTNISGKRLLPLGSQVTIAKNKIARPDADGKSKSLFLVKESVETAKSYSKGKENMYSCMLGSFVDDDKGKEVLSLGSMHSSKSMSLDLEGRKAQNNMFSSGLFSLDFSKHEEPAVNDLGRGSLSFGAISQQCSKSSESSAELEDDDCLEDHEADCVDSMRYSFLSEKSMPQSAVSDQTGLDFAVPKESQAEIVGCPDNDPGVKLGFMGHPNPFESFNFKVDSVGNFLNASSSCGHVDKDSVDACNCSFCLKAVYMLMDLHYQDTRGRLSALKRSKRLAMSFQGRICGNDYGIKTTPDATESPAELDLELSQRWRSLFLHTENVLVRETAQLHASLLKLKEFKENCKRDLEMLSFTSSRN